MSQKNTQIILLSIFKFSFPNKRETQHTSISFGMKSHWAKNVLWVYFFRITFLRAIDCSVFIFFVPLRLPFDWKTPYGYLLVAVTQCWSAYYVIQVTIFLLTFFVTSCWTLMATIDDMKENISNLNEIAKCERNDEKLHEKLAQFITLNSDSKQ